MIKTVLKSMCAVALLAVATGCANLPGKTNLAEVANRSGLTNVTTGDGTFEDYTATGHHSSHEIGIGLGLGLLKLMEFWPAVSNEAQMTHIAEAAKADGANAMINATPPKSLFIPFPFIIVGIYVDSTQGTGINVK